MSIVAVSSLDWPTSDELDTVSVQCAGEAFLDYHVRKLNHRSFRHGSFFMDSEEDDDSQEMAVEENDDFQKRDLLSISHEELEVLSHYQVLGDIPMHSSTEQVKRAYHKACLLFHPDKTGRDEEDEVFLKVKAAFDCLSDISKRKAYDSTIDFDDSVPRGNESSSEFYREYSPVFERNLRFDARNDPARRLSKKGGKRRHVNAKNKPPPMLGDDDLSIEQVHEFYDYWIHFESWRDFSLKAQDLIEGNMDVDTAESRYEKRWIQKEIDKKAKQLKKEEMARINTLVERAMAADPRLKRQRQLDKEEKERLIRERQELEKQERLQQEKEALRLAQEQKEKEQLERQAKAEAKAQKEKEKKVLRKARQSFRRLAMDSFQQDNQSIYKSLHDFNDDVELLCSELSATHITDLTTSLEQESDRIIAHVHDAAVQTKQERANARKLGEQQKLKARKAAAIKEQKAKAAKATNPWTKEELSALAKAVKKYPAGGANRWETIALFVNNLCKPQVPRTKEECIEKYNQIASQKPKTTNSTSTSSASGAATTPSTAWTDEQDKQLQQGLAKYPASMDKNERWTLIAKGVSGKGKKDCVQRFKAIREAIKKK